MMTRSSFAWSALLAIPALSAGVILAPSNASASVTLKGCIKWFHPDYPGGQKWPLKFNKLEVEFNHAGDDPDIKTNANGCYQASVRNAYAGNGHNVNLQPYAQRAFLGKSGARNLYVRVFENMVDREPTWFESRSVHVNDDSKGTLNLWIGNNEEFGGTQENFKTGNLVFAPRSYYYWNMVAADIIGRYYDKMFSNGFKQHKGVDVIAPAAGTTSYFNFISNNINLTLSATPNAKGSFRNWVGTLLHEATHALHAHSSPSNTPVAEGLKQPSVHSWRHETNRQLAWTEGFAAFLPVPYLTSWGGLGKYAAYPAAPATPDGKKVTYNSNFEDHTSRVQPGSLVATTPKRFHMQGSASSGGAEGYVAGFLWDLVDSQANTQVHPGFDTWKFKVPGFKNGRQLRKCQLENTSPRTYRGLPGNAALMRDSRSVAALSKSTDCISLPMKEISNLLSRRMYQDVQFFGVALMAGADADFKYELLKAYANNGMLYAAPWEMNHKINWSISQASTSLMAKPAWGDAGRPANATTAQDRVRSHVSIKIPVAVSHGSTVQFRNATCKFTSAIAFTGCGTYSDPSGTGEVVRAVIKKSDFCNGTGNVSRASVGTSEKSPIYVALDDGINPVAIRVGGICSAQIRS